MSPLPSAPPSIRSATATKTSTSNATAIVVDTRCKYVASSGRRCRVQAARDTSRASGFSAFCLPHAQMEQQYLDSKSVSEELIGDLDDFRTFTSVSEVLGKLLVLVAENRIPLRNANTIAYICQLLTSSNAGVRYELNLRNGKDGELYVINRTMDMVYGTGDEEEEKSDQEQSANNESDQLTGQNENQKNTAQQKTDFQNQVD